ncbi:MAG: hypothetical protein ABW221_08930 [Vicinamibacteria bacterium]
MRAVLQNAWILAGVFLLGWSPALAIGASYLESLFTSAGLAIALRRARRGDVPAGQGTAGAEARETVVAGVGLGALLVLFYVGILLQQPLETVWSDDVALVVAGALLAAAADYVFVQRALGVESDAWVGRRVVRQQRALFGLILMILVVGFSFPFVGERSALVTLFVLKALLDTWTAAPAHEGS